MTDATYSIGWSISAYYFVIVFSILNTIIFIGILIKMTRLYPKYSKAIKSNVYAIIVLITIIIRSIVASLVQTELVVNFTETCYNKGLNGCLRCNISGGFDQMMILTSIVTRLLVFLRALEINFQKFPLLAYPPKFILGGKIVVILIWLVVNTLILTKFPLNHAIYHLKSDESIHLCLQGLEDETKSNRQKLMGAFVPFLLIAHILFCILFIIKANKLYKFTRNNITSSDPKKIKQGLKALQSIIKSMIRHTILVLCMTSSFLFLIVIPRLANPDGFGMEQLDGLIVGLCIFMMYPFGEGLFNTIFGCCKSRLMIKWFHYEYQYLYNRNKSCSLSFNSNSSKDTNPKKKSSGISKEQIKIEFAVPDLPRNKSDLKDLSIIVEESRTTSNESFTGPIPSFSKWNSTKLQEQTISEEVSIR